MKILLFGRNGQAGWELQRSLAPLGEVIALDRDSAGLCGDLTNVEGLAQTVRTVWPDVIVNAAAYTAVDKAESEPDLARAVNATAPGVLAQAAHATGAWFVHYSSDYVFDGSGETPWKEDDVTGPLNVYGRTKLEGEQRVRALCGRHLILRTSWVYSARGNNFTKTMLKLARERDSFAVVDDQFGAPTGAELLADTTAMALKSLLSGSGHPGLYHVSAAGVTTWFHYARKIVGHAQGRGASLRVSPERVEPTTTDAFPTAAARPLNSRLDTASFRQTFGLALPAWEHGVDRMIDEILAKDPTP